MIKKIDDSVWQKINEENQKFLENRIINKYGKHSQIENNDDYFSSADNSQITDSDFGIVEDDEIIFDNIKKNNLKKK